MLHPLHRAWRLLPARSRRMGLVRLATALAPRPEPSPPAVRPGLAVAGELARASGLGEGARLMLRAAEALGIETWPIDVGTVLERGAQAVLPPEGVPIVFHVNAPLLPQALLRLPRPLLRGRRIIGYWAWELPTLPPDWTLGAGFVHQAWVPSQFTARALGALRPETPRVVPHPLACCPPVAAALDRAAFGLPPDAVVVLVSFSLASAFERKNPLGAIATFQAAFGARPDRVLLLKIGSPDDFPEDFHAIVDRVAGIPNIRLETRALPRAESHALTRCCDILLSLHRAEGFGLVPAEAMLLQVPVIATGWSGNMDFMDDTSAALVGYRLVPARDHRAVFEAPGAVWAEPDQEAAARHLVRLADDAGARRALGALGHRSALRHLGVEPLRVALAALREAVPA